MSAITSPSTVQSEGPGFLSPPPPPVAPRKPLAPKVVFVALLLVIIAGVALYLFRSRPQIQQRAAATQVRTVAVVTGTLDQTLRLNGATSARNFAMVSSPRLRGPDIRDLVLMSLVPSGTMVKKGQLLAQIDAQAAKDHVDDVNSLVEQAATDVKKRQAEQAIEMETLLQSVRTAKAELDKAKLDLSAAEVRTAIDAELLKLSVEEAEAEYKELLANVPITVEEQKADLRVLELTRERHVRHRDRHAGDIKKLTIVAPIGGLAVMQSIWRAGEMRQIQEGDQVSPGEPFMRVVDTSSMQVDATANQVEAEQMRLGLPATVRFDAFPGLTMPAKIYAIGALAVGGWRENYYIRNVPIRLLIEGQDQRVIPDLSAAADVHLLRKENVLLIPLAAVSQQGRQATVQVKTANGFETRPVELGSQTNTLAEVVSGLSKGEQVVVAR